MRIRVTTAVEEWFRTRRPVSKIVKGLIDAAAAWAKGLADRIPFSRKHQ